MREKTAHPLAALPKLASAARRAGSGSLKARHGAGTFWASVAFLFCSGLLAETVTVTLPASASLLGGAPFFSDVRAFNRSYTDSLTVTATYRCFIGNPCPGVAAQTIFVLEPRQSRAFDDMTGSTFASPNTAGGVEFEYQGQPGQLIVTSRLYSTSPTGTVGMFIPGLEDWEAHPTTVLTSIRHGGAGPGYRTNVGAFNPGEAPVTATFTIFDERAQVGSPVERDVEGHSGVQISGIFEEANAADATTDNAVIIVSSTGPVFSYAAVIDNTTTDPIFVVGGEDLPQQPVTPAVTQTVTLPATASLVGGAPFFSDVRAFNKSNTDTLRVKATYRCFIGNPCPGYKAQTIFVLWPRESRAFDDMTGSTFTSPNTAGGVEFEYEGQPGQLVVTSRLYSTSPMPTVGMFVPALEDWEAHPTTVLTSIRHGGAGPGYRTNVGAFNPGDWAVTVTFTIFVGRNQVGSPVERDVEGHSGVQVSGIFEEANAADVTTGNAVIIVSSTGPVFSYAAVIDNATTDPIFVVGGEDLPQQPVTPVATETPTVPEPTATGTPILPGPTATATPTLPGPTATPTLPGPTATPTLPGPTATPTLPGPTATPTLPGPTATPTLPGPTATPTLPGPTATPTLPGPTATRTPTLPGPTATPTLPGPTATRTPTLPGPTATPTLPGPTATRTPTVPAPTATSTPTVPAPTATPTRTPTVPAPTATPTRTPTPGTTTHTVYVDDDIFVDQASGTSTTTANVGDTVHWVWVGTDDHDTVSGTNCNPNGNWASPEQQNGTFDHIFNQAGNFPYFCTPHCDNGMTGTIIVNP